ncbi:IclR family transcriptional regulator [Microbacterium sp.]|uniref:IclR family transcriptional regulator n=1 Tax=Microbacterium sp. TaxID=51671 RepID=UPI0039E6B13F
MANSRSGESMTERIVRVLDTFAGDRTAQTAAEIGRRAGLPASTAHRVVADLVRSGLLERDTDHRVRLGMRLWELALHGSAVLRLRRVALPHMDQVQSAIRQHTQLAVLEDDEALIVERLSHPEATENVTRITGRLPLRSSSAGLVLLAHADPPLRERVLAGSPPAQRPALARVLGGIRRAGHVVAPGLVDAGATGVAVPIRDAGAVVAALSVVLPRTESSDDSVRALRAAARAIEAELRASRRQGSS